MPEIKTSNSPNPLLIIIPGIFLLGALLGGIYFYQKRVSGVSTEPTTTPDYSNTITPSPTSTPTSTQLDLTKYPINVMNGSGTPGQAGTVKDLLTGAGFKVSAAGNASSYDYTKTVIKVKADVPAEFVTVTVLLPRFTVAPAALKVNDCDVVLLLLVVKVPVPFTRIADVDTHSSPSVEVPALIYNCDDIVALFLVIVPVACMVILVTVMVVPLLRVTLP